MKNKHNKEKKEPFDVVAEAPCATATTMRIPNLNEEKKKD
jgi:hypothetical protein